MASSGAGFYNPISLSIDNLTKSLGRTYDRRLKMEQLNSNERLRTQEMALAANDPRKRLEMLTAARDMERVPLDISAMLPPNASDHRMETERAKFEPVLNQILGRDNMGLNAKNQVINKKTKQIYQPYRFIANEDMALINVAAFGFFGDPRITKQRELDDIERTQAQLVKKLGPIYKARNYKTNDAWQKNDKVIKKLKETLADPAWKLKATETSMIRTRDMINRSSAIQKNDRAMNLLKWEYERDAAQFKALVKEVGGDLGGVLAAKWYSHQWMERADGTGKALRMPVAKHPAAWKAGVYEDERGMKWLPSEKPDKQGIASLRSQARQDRMLVESQLHYIAKTKTYMAGLKAATNKQNYLDSILTDMKENTPLLYDMVRGVDANKVYQMFKNEVEGAMNELMTDYTEILKKKRPHLFLKKEDGKEIVGPLRPAKEKIHRDQARQAVLNYNPGLKNDPGLEGYIDTYLKNNPE